MLVVILARRSAVQEVVLLLKSVKTSWAIGLGGVAAEALLLVSLLGGFQKPWAHTVAWILSWLIAAVTLFWAFFRAWRTEFHIRLKIEKLLILRFLSTLRVETALRLETLALSAACSESEVIPALEDLVMEGWLTETGDMLTYVPTLDRSFPPFPF